MALPAAPERLAAASPRARVPLRCSAVVPPEQRIYVPFFTASLLLTLTFGATLGMINLARLTGTWGALPRPSVWAHGYVQVFGFLGLFVMGFAYHAVPRFAGVAFARRGWAVASLRLQLGGVLAIVAGFLFVPAHARILWRVGAGAICLATVLFVASLGATLRARTTPHEAFEGWVLAAAAWFAVSAASGLAAAAGDDPAWHHVLWPAALLGAAASWVFGVGRRLFPLSLGWRVRRRLDRPAFVLYQSAAVAWCVGAWPAPALSSVRLAAAVALPPAVLLVAATLGLFHRPERPGRDEGYARYVRTAWTWLFVGVAAASLMTFAAARDGSYPPLLGLDFVRHTLALGFATQMLMGVGCRFVPVFNGTRLWSARAHAACFWLLNAAVVLRGLEGVIAAGYWPRAWPLLAAAGPPAVAAVVLFALNIALSLRRRDRR
jgi:hypothetical protein